MSISITGESTNVSNTNVVKGALYSWETFNEDISAVDEDTKIIVVGLLEHLNVTRDSTDYLWYTTRRDQLSIFFHYVSGF